MPNTISNVSNTQVAAPAVKIDTPKATAKVSSDAKAPASEPARPAKTDSVHLSAVAQAAIASLKEATETPAQTAKEAGSGDLQAKRLLVKESASHLG